MLFFFFTVLASFSFGFDVLEAETDVKTVKSIFFYDVDAVFKRILCFEHKNTQNCKTPAWNGRLAAKRGRGNGTSSEAGGAWCGVWGTWEVWECGECRWTGEIGHVGKEEL